MASAVPIDPRLVPALAELAAHPDWTGGTPFDAFTVTDVTPGPEFLCVELALAASQAARSPGRGRCGDAVACRPDPPS